jgi:hypothetical protein
MGHPTFPAGRNLICSSASKKTMKISVFDKKAPNTKPGTIFFRGLLKILKPKSLQIVNACAELGEVTNFRLQSSAIVGVVRQRLNKVFTFMLLLLVYCGYVNGDKISVSIEPEDEVNQPQPTNFMASAEDLYIFEHLMQWSRDNQLSDKPLQDVVVAIARQFYGKPYVAHTLEQEGAERLVVNLRELDCTTFVESVLALSICIKSEQTAFYDFLKILQKLRYRSGILNAYPSRLHYFSDWLTDNQKIGLVTLISNEFGDMQFNSEVSFMTNNAGKYPKLFGNSEFIEQMSVIEDSVSRNNWRCVSGALIGEVEGKIQNGDIIAFCTEIDGLDISHLGLALHTANGLHFIHATTNGDVVKISELSLSQYVKNRKSIYGILVARPLL